MHLLALGYTNQEIGKKLFISVRTVDTHRAHIMRKLELETRAELVMFALANGVIGPNAGWYGGRNDHNAGGMTPTGVGWPALPYEEWRATCDTLHAHTQVLGKLAARSPRPSPSSSTPRCD